MGRKTTKSILSRDEISLLRNSEEPKNTKLYGNLYFVLDNLEFLKAVAIEDLEQLDEIGVAALTYNKQSLLNNVKQEWYTESVSEEDPDKKVRCGLCNTPNKYLFYITNRMNGNRLNVGSMCMTKFPDIEGYSEYSHHLKVLQKNHKAVIRRTEFHTKFPNVNSILDSSSYYFDNLPILLPYDIYFPLKDVVTRLRLIYAQYVESGKKPFESTKTSFELFQLAVNQYKKLKKLSDDFIRNNIDNPLICKQREVEWLIENDRKHLVKIISQNNGEYTESTVSHINHYGFVKEHLDKFVTKNNSALLKINLPKVESNYFNTFCIKPGYTPYLMLKTPFKEFMLKIGSRCLFDNTYTYSGKELLALSSIANTRTNIESIIGYTANMMNRINYIFLLDYQIESLYLLRRADRAVIKIKISNFLNSYSKFILKKDDAINSFLLNMIQSLKKEQWITVEQQERKGIKEKIDIMYKEQYIDSLLYEPKNSGSQNQYIEIPLYKQNRTSDTINPINFDGFEYVKYSKRILSVPSFQIKNIDYAFRNYEKNYIALIHSTNKISETESALYSIDGMIKNETYDVYLKEDNKLSKRLYGKILGYI